MGTNRGRYKHRCSSSKPYKPARGIDETGTPDPIPLLHLKPKRYAVDRTWPSSLQPTQASFILAVLWCYRNAHFPIRAQLAPKAVWFYMQYWNKNPVFILAKKIFCSKRLWKIYTIMLFLFWIKILKHKINPLSIWSTLLFFNETSYIEKLHVEFFIEDERFYKLSQHSPNMEPNGIWKGTTHVAVPGLPTYRQCMYTPASSTVGAHSNCNSLGGGGV